MNVIVPKIEYAGEAGRSMRRKCELRKTVRKSQYMTATKKVQGCSSTTSNMY